MFWNPIPNRRRPDFPDRVRTMAQETWDRVRDRSVRVAVTGLSQSGKTVFITSLINQLLHPNRLPHLQAAAEHRLIASRLETLPELQVPEFPYWDNMRRIGARDPEWPDPTDRIRAVRIAVRHTAPRRLGRQTPRTLHIDLIDYPGEWLLDLPLLTLDFDTWSRQVWAQCEREPRRSLARDWLAFAAGLDPDAPADEADIRRGQQLYTDFLHRARQSEHALSLLQPGRFLVPGDLAEAPILAFFPLLREGGNAAPKESLHATLAARFEAYKERVVARFYREEFSRFDRQIVLVDVLRALRCGPASFEDTRDALTVALQSFHYGKSGLLNRLFRNKIDRLLFAATKADHVAANQHHNLRLLLDSLVADAARDIRFEGVALQSLALAAVECTETVVTDVQGHRLSCLKGVTKDSDRQRILFPGEVPAAVPDAEAWDTDRFRFLEYRLPRFEALERRALPHIHLDRALDFLIGDKLA